jgi:hypothetical protein
MTLVSSKAHGIPIGRNDFDEQQGGPRPANIGEDEVGKILSTYRHSRVKPLSNLGRPDKR